MELARRGAAAVVVELGSKELHGASYWTAYPGKWSCTPQAAELQRIPADVGGTELHAEEEGEAETARAHKVICIGAREERATGCSPDLGRRGPWRPQRGGGVVLAPAAKTTQIQGAGGIGGAGSGWGAPAGGRLDPAEAAQQEVTGAGGLWIRPPQRRRRSQGGGGQRWSTPMVLAGRGAAARGGLGRGGCGRLAAGTLRGGVCAAWWEVASVRWLARWEVAGGVVGGGGVGWVGIGEEIGRAHV